MSIGQRLDEDELSDTSLQALYSVLGERDTPSLFDRPYAVDFEHDIPSAGANSVDRKTKYIDRTLYAEVMDGEFKATGLEPQQLIERWLDHEHCELCIIDGDNPVDTYAPGHKRALKLEHIGVLAILGRKDGLAKIRNYESVIWPGLVRCYHRPIKKPPKDLWCGPYLDDPTPRDYEILDALSKFGVYDAAKHSKYDVHYGFGHDNCDKCSGWNPDFMAQEQKQLAACHRVNGLVRYDRHCDLWREIPRGG